MLNVIRSLFSGSASSARNPELDEEIPRYPPFAKGLPVAPIEKVVETQSELVERIRNALGLTAEQHKQVLLPVVFRYAEFVHLLPASESHHHRGAGGLFRHGLEVAFWAAQASEAVIFSMQGSPRERRDNEPRWRLASCFAGLLHDVGKPLYDVTVTEKSGNMTWNPYANSLHGWAQVNGIDRYFLRWRDNRHKRHEQFSLLAVEKIIPREVFQYLSEPGPEILASMLEALAGTSTNQPVTKLMLKADQESVIRDLRQSRLNVDEFSYGVPVERYVFDAIRRLVKTGKWKVNEPGARIWNVQQGVFIAWRNLGDLYEMIARDNIPGVPRDPDTLADILIERDFAIPNSVVGTGEVPAQYRYWELCPDMLQEGRPDGSVKLLVLRMQSHDLVFTTEPPPPVAAVLVGEKPEPVIEFEDIETDEGGSVNQDATIDGTSPGDTSNEFADAYAIIASAMSEASDDSPLLEGLIHEPSDTHISSAGDEESNDGVGENVTDSSYKKATGDDVNIADIEMPLFDGQLLAAVTDVKHELGLQAGGLPGFDSVDRAGVAGSESVPAKPAKVDLLGVSKVKSSTGDLEETFVTKNGANRAQESVDTGTRLRKSNAALTKTPPAPKDNENPSVTSQMSDLNSSTSRKKSAREKLDARLALLDEAPRVIIAKAIMPILDGEFPMGKIVSRLGGEAAILYPDGAAQIGEPADVLKILWNAGLISSDPVMPGKRIRSVNGHSGLVFVNELSNLILRAVDEVSEIKDQALSPEISNLSEAGTSSAKVEKRVKRTDKPKEVSARVEIAEPVTTLPIPTDDVKQNVTQARPAKRRSRTPQIVSDVPVAETPIPEFGEKMMLVREKTDLQSTIDFDVIQVNATTPEQAINQLKQMIQKREGKWLTSPVRKEKTKRGVCLVTSAGAFDVIANEFTSLARSSLRLSLQRQASKPLMLYEGGELYLLTGEEDTK